MNDIIQSRLHALRELMKENGITAYLVPTEDFHGSEYVGEFFKCRKYLTGFTGSAGTALVMADMAGVWTDGRYFIQAADQLSGTGFTLFRSGEKDVPDLHKYLKEHLTGSDVLGFDGRVFSAQEAAKYKEELTPSGVRIRPDVDLVGQIWAERPALPCHPVMELGIAYAGETRKSKLARIREAMAKENASVFLLSSLDDIAWLLNIRGGDVLCNPVVLSYLLMDERKAFLYANKEAFSQEILSSLGEDGVHIKPYDQIYEDIGTLPADGAILLCKSKVNSLLFEKIPAGKEVIDKPNPTLLPKALKNRTEQENMRLAHIRDGVALTKFVYWLKRHAGEEGVSELSVADKLYEYRSAQPHFMGNSFEPIISYGSHAAIVHYSATEETDIPILKKGMVLCDTGGQYLEGTTDVTRTIVVGELTEEEKTYFTAVLQGHVALADVVFVQGCNGANLDILAREPLWRMGKDYNHGTGHGVGYFLNVHEGPNRFHWRIKEGIPVPAVMEEGMITSDEPGYYEEGKFGIRHESLLLCKKVNEAASQVFLGFEELTLCPFDREGIVTAMLSPREKAFIDAYHEKVWEELSPYMEEDEKAWLREATRPL